SPRFPRYATWETTGPKPCWWLAARSGPACLDSCVVACRFRKTGTHISETCSRGRAMNDVRYLLALCLFLLVFFGARAVLRAMRRRLAARRWAKAPQRDVSGLAGAGAADFKREVISTGGAWKRHLRRLVLRDNRLLPKQPPDPNSRVWPRP